MTIGQPGWGVYSLSGGQDPFPSLWLRQQLAADTLILSDQVIEVVAKRAIYYVCAPQLGRLGDIPFRELAQGFAEESDNMIKLLRAEIDLNGDGSADMIINTGATNLR